ncbi:MAG: leucyl/phenylalanyl-tRNA--protein transferase [Pseudomonadota bacterium]
MTRDLTPELLLQAYASGIFPMAERRDDDEVFWVDPHERGVMPLDGFHISRSLRRTIRSGRFTVTVDRDFEGVIDGCADRPETWINPTIRRLYAALFRRGRAHSLEVWEDAGLVGGVYGVSLGAAFFGESMFSRRTDASKVALAYLVDRLRQGGFVLFDAQFLTAHLASLGAIEIPRTDYRARLDAALAARGDFTGAGPVPTPQTLLQRMTQTS